MPRSIKVVLATAAAAISVSAPPASAQGGGTVAEFQSWCRGFEAIRPLPDGRVAMPADREAALCWGAFTAIQQLSATTETPRGKLMQACIPPAATRLEMLQIVLRYMDQHPEREHEYFAGVAWNALEQAFPCR